MTKKYTLAFIAMQCLLIGFSQQQIYLLDFETSGGYTTSIPECTDGADDYFTRTDGSNVNSVLNNIQGSNYFTAQDVDAAGCPNASGARAFLTIDDINISGFTNLEFRVFLAEDDASDGNDDWDSEEFVHFDYDIDNSSAFTNLLHLESLGNSGSTAPYIDTDFNGQGDGAEITDTFTQFTSLISGTGTLLDIRLTIDLNAGDEDIAIDHIEIWGNSSGPSIGLSTSSLTGFTYVEGAGPSSEQVFSVTGSNLTDDIDIAPPANWEISTASGGPFQTSTITLNEISGSVNTTNIYVRLISGLLNANSPYSNTITLSSTGANTQNVSLNGSVTLAGSCASIFTDDFSGTLSQWTNTNDWTISGGELKHNLSSTESESYIYADIGLQDLTTGDYEWEFCMRNGNWDPSSSNDFVYHLISNNSDLQSNASGYGVGINQTGFSDLLSLYVINNGVYTELLASGLNWDANDDVCVRVTRNDAGQWSLFYSANGGAEVNAGAIMDTSYTSGQYTGAFFDFSSTRAGQLWLDDISICKTPTCTATHTISSFSPSTGPVNTQITINGSGFTSGSSATIGGVSASIVSQLSNQLVIEVPANGISGIIEITENGCVVASVSNFDILSSKDLSCDGGVTATDLFISEITDSTLGALSYIEIFNGTGAPVSLNGYSLDILQNGAANVPTSGSYTLNLDPTFILANNSTYVVAIGTVSSPDYVDPNANSCDIDINGNAVGNGELADQPTGNAGINVENNNNDFVRLMNGTTRIDEFGVYRGRTWMESTGITGDRGFNFRRLPTASPLPNPNFDINNYLNEWEEYDWPGSGVSSCSGNDYSNIGIFDSQKTPPSISSISKTDNGCGGSGTVNVVALEGFDGTGDTKNLTFQWYSLAPNDTSWGIVTDSGIYSNSTTDTLNISDTSGLDGYQFYCEVREDDADCFVVSEAIIFSIDSATWNGSTWNWSDNTPVGTTPTSSDAVIIDGNYNTSTSGSFEACNLTINSGTLNITNSNYVNVVNDVTLNGGNLTVQTKGALIQQGINADAGSFTVNSGSSSVNKRTARLQNYYDYTYWGSPITNGVVGTTLFSTNENRRYWFDANNFVDSNDDGIDDNGDAWTLADASLPLTPGMGIATTHDQNVFTPNTAYTYTFSGPFNTGDISYAVVYNTANDGTLHWNLLGNPYPSALDVDEFFTTNINTLGRAVYMWSHVRPPLGSNPGNEVLNFNQNDYVTINHAGEAGNGADTDDDGDIDADDIPLRRIPSGQGFFMATITSGNALFTNDMRVSGQDSNNQFYRTPSTTNQSPYREKLWLNLSSEIGIYSQICLVYMDDATAGYDGNSYDTARNYAGNAGTLFSMIQDQGETEFVIQAKALHNLNEDEVVKIGFGAYVSTTETYIIDLLKFEGSFLSSNTIYLKDNYLGRLHDISTTAYTFESEGGYFTDRFELVFKQNSTLSSDEFELDSNALKIIELDTGEVKFLLTNTYLAIETVSIYDLQGRLIYNLKGSSSVEIYDLSALSASGYIANVTLSNGQIISQKALKQH